jgi:hypothetical protein
MTEKNDHSSDARKPALPAGVVLLWVALGTQLLTFCGGKADEQTGQSGSGGQAGVSGHGGSENGGSDRPGFGGDNFAGHTAGCLANNTCGQGNGGFGGFAGQSGSAGMAGFSGQTGFGGHTAGCIGTCGGPCPPCPGTGGNQSEAGDAAPVEAGRTVRDAQSTEAMTNAASQLVAALSCYVLSGYEPDPCLPADDSLLSWLSNVPTGCQPHVTAGPFAGADDSQGRTCCYSVICE